MGTTEDGTIAEQGVDSSRERRHRFFGRGLSISLPCIPRRGKSPAAASADYVDASIMLSFQRGSSEKRVSMGFADS